MVESYHPILTPKTKQRNGHMFKTKQEMETEAILSMVENMKMLEQQLADAKARIDSLEKVIANQRAMINELQ
jgi:N-methylhydantoinase B/oxoprolinase/acetone carboxylase alpha subunit